jgi:hypothetical protein
MDEKARPVGGSIEETKDIAGDKVAGDSRPIDKGSNLFYINERGEYCFGTSCFSMRIKPGSGEVRVVVDRNECGIDAEQVVDALFGEVSKGAPTVYEAKSKVEK